MKKENLKNIEKSIMGGDSFIFVSTGGHYYACGRQDELLGLLISGLKAFAENSCFSKEFIKEQTGLAFLSSEELKRKVEKDMKEKGISEKDIEKMKKEFGRM